MSEVFSKENFILLELGLEELSIERNDVIEKDLEKVKRIIEKQYRKLALKYHPDKHLDKTEDKKTNLAAKSRKIGTVHSLLIEAIDLIRENKSLSDIEYKLHKLCAVVW